MNDKHYVVQGATCQCNLSAAPETDILLVKSQTRHYANDSDAHKKLIATDKEVGQTMKKNTFGKCTNQPRGTDYALCVVDITEWKGSNEKVIYTNQGKALLENSKATCSFGLPDCISIVNHGQTAELTEKNIKNSSPQILAEILPGINFSDLQDEGLLIYATKDE